nr:elongation factor P--(R)-beta-lysine ligase [Spirochaetaceae bacterium]
FLIMTLEETFLKWAGFSLGQNNQHKDLFQRALELDLAVDEADSRADIFNLILVSLIEPQLPKDRFTILMDYPSYIATLSKPIPQSPWTERWEIYLGELELANCFTEAMDAEQIKQYYTEELKHINDPIPKVDWAFPQLLSTQRESISGTALGVDRLLMALLEISKIQGVLLFPLL